MLSIVNLLHLLMPYQIHYYHQTPVSIAVPTLACSWEYSSQCFWLEQAHCTPFWAQVEQLLWSPHLVCKALALSSGPHSPVIDRSELSMHLSSVFSFASPAVLADFELYLFWARGLRFAKKAQIWETWLLVRVNLCLGSSIHRLLYSHCDCFHLTTGEHACYSRVSHEYWLRRPRFFWQLVG